MQTRRLKEKLPNGSSYTSGHRPKIARNSHCSTQELFNTYKPRSRMNIDDLEELRRHSGANQSYKSRPPELQTLFVVKHICVKSLEVEVQYQLFRKPVSYQLAMPTAPQGSGPGPKPYDDDESCSWILYCKRSSPCAHTHSLISSRVTAARPQSAWNNVSKACACLVRDSFESDAISLLPAAIARVSGREPIHERAQSGRSKLISG